MNIVCLFLLFAICCDMKFAGKDQYFEDYCSVRQTNAIKGICVLAVFLCHSMDYFYFVPDTWIEYISEYFRQLIVVPFFFYSGYGIMESIRKKGHSYVKSIPLKRCLRTMLYADIAVLAFAVLYLVQGSPLSVKQVFLSLIFWSKIENNTWYIFVNIALYLITYIAFMIFRKNHYAGAVATALLSLVLFYFLIATKSIIWYNTFFAYHFGMWYSLLRKGIEKVVMRNDIVYLIALLMAFLAYTLFRTFGSFYYFNICGCWLMTIIVGITMKIKIDNPFLQFLGRHVLAFYVFHRLPMVLTFSMEMDTVSKCIFSFLATSILALIHDKIIEFLDPILFNRSVDKQRSVSTEA